MILNSYWANLHHIILPSLHLDTDMVTAVPCAASGRLGAWDGRVDLLRYLPFATSTDFFTPRPNKTTLWLIAKRAKRERERERGRKREGESQRCIYIYISGCVCVSTWSLSLSLSGPEEATPLGTAPDRRSLPVRHAQLPTSDRQTVPQLGPKRCVT